MSIQDYQIISKLGAGSFGVVHKARDKKTNNICVIKMVDISKMDAKMRKSAIDQGRILKEMNSPFIVKHFNTFINKTTLHIVLQYCSKGDLAAFMKAQMGKPFKQQMIWKLSIQMMVGLRDLHAKKILHRDIKTLNIFLDEKQNVRIGDLGVAKTMKTDFANTMVGTLYYLSPEMCQGKSYNQKTDIWSMGCIIYELCARKRPFEATNQTALALKIVLGKFENIPSHYSSDLSWIIKSCLSLDYKRRPTAAYLLAMPKTKQWAAKLNILIESNLVQKSPIKEEQKIIKKQQIQTEKIVKMSPKPIDKSNIKFQQKPNSSRGDQDKPRKQSQRNIKQIVNNKVCNDTKQKKLSGAKRLQMKVKQQEKYNNKQKQQKKDIKMPPKQKIQQTKTKNVDVKGYRSEMPKNSNEKKQDILDTTMNKFLPEKFKHLKQFDYQDERNSQMIQVPDSDNSSQKQQKSAEKNVNTKKDIFHEVQQMVNDDDLAKQFGIVELKNQANKDSKRQQKIAHFKLDKKPLSINWNQIGNESEVIRKNRSIRQGQIPTIKSPSSVELDTLIQLKIDEEQMEGVVQQQINENRPYISDEEEDEQDSAQQQFLIQDLEQKQQDLVQKMRENEKRMDQLQKRREQYYQPELLKFMPKDQYEKLKVRLIQGQQNDVEQFVASWRNNMQCMSLFYRLIHLDIEIKRCQTNLSMIESKIQQVKKQKS